MDEKEIELINSAFDIRDGLKLQGFFKLFTEEDPVILETNEGDKYELKIWDNRYILVGPVKDSIIESIC
jgi:hypothetical protein